jgi:hypothetical protein
MFKSKGIQRKKMQNLLRYFMMTYIKECVSIGR